MKHIKFSSIDQFRHAIKELIRIHTYSGNNEEGYAIYDNNKILPSVTFHGTIKLHGTNAAICVKGEDVWFQSRSNIITPLKDNAGFAGHFSASKKIESILKLDKLFRGYNNISPDDQVTYFGEWIGKGIQRGVALNELDRRFVMFSVMVGEDKYLDPVTVGRELVSSFSDEDSDIYNILDFNQWVVNIDLNNPLDSYDKIMEYTSQVEKECPFAKEFGVSGIGEGIVWTHFERKSNTCIRFKTKGEKHSVVGKSPKSPLDPEKLKGVSEFVDYTVTENRLKQGIEQVFSGGSPDIKMTGEFLRWVVGDIIKEEIDTLESSGLSVKDVTGQLSNKARKWFLDEINKI